MIDFGTDPHKLHRRDAPLTSVAAAHAVDTTKMERMVYEIVLAFGENGCILDDVWRYLVATQYPNRPAHDPIFMSLGNTVSARFKALEEKGLIYYTGETRAGASGRQSRVRVASVFKEAMENRHDSTG